MTCQGCKCQFVRKSRGKIPSQCRKCASRSYYAKNRHEILEYARKYNKTKKRREYLKRYRKTAVYKTGQLRWSGRGDYFKKRGVKIRREQAQLAFQLYMINLATEVPT